MEPVAGVGSDPRIAENARDRVAYFFACPLVAGGESMGAVAVCAERDEDSRRNGEFDHSDKQYLELCAGVIASAIQNRRRLERIGRLEGFIQEIGSNLVRERERSKIGERSVEYHTELDENLRRLRELLSGEDASQRLSEISDAVEAMQRHSGAYWESVVAGRSNYAMTDLFGLVARAVEAWRPAAEKVGVEVTTRIPSTGPSLLLDRDNLNDALEKILATTLSCLGKDDRVLVECSHSRGRAVVCIADSGIGLPGDVVSRLFMPFAEAGESNQGKRALSLAGDILQKHSAEIMVKSSRSWRTILVLSFPTAAGRDRRKRGKDRRRRPDRRRVAAGRR
jgi:signal transduction histidine kinase